MSNDHIRLDRSKWEPCDKCKICLRRRAHDSSNYKTAKTS